MMSRGTSTDNSNTSNVYNFYLFESDKSDKSDKSPEKDSVSKAITPYSIVTDFLCSRQLRFFSVVTACLSWYTQEKTIKHVLTFPLTSLWNISGKISSYALLAEIVARYFPDLTKSIIPVFLLGSAAYFLSEIKNQL